jgi:hypothetical protein
LQGDTPGSYGEEVLLNRADAFTCTHIGLFIGGITPAGATAPSSNYTLYPYTSLAVDTASTSGGVSTSNILFNNSNLNIAINNVQYLQNFDTRRFNTAGVIQENIVTSTSVNGGVAQDSLNGDAGFVAIVPTLQFSGTSKIDIQINLPSALSVASGVAYQINLIFRGFLSLGASNLNK